MALRRLISYSPPGPWKRMRKLRLRPRVVAGPPLLRDFATPFGWQGCEVTNSVAAFGQKAAKNGRPQWAERATLLGC